MQAEGSQQHAVEPASDAQEALPPQFYSVGNPIVRSRNLVANVVHLTKQKLFGSATIFDPHAFRECIAIPRSDVRAYLAQRLERAGIDDIDIPSGAPIDQTVVVVAQQIARRHATAGSALDPRKIERIALEYVLAACYLAPAAIEAFGRYLDHSLTFRDAAKHLNRAAEVSTEEAFVRGSRRDMTPLMRYNTNAIEAWEAVHTLLMSDVHLATLRTRFLAPFLYPKWSVWQQLAGIEPVRRSAVCAELRVLLTEERIPFVTSERFERAVELVDGNLLLSGGNPFGVTTGTFVGAMRHARMPGGTSADGAQFGFVGSPAGSIGSTISGLRGGVDGTINLEEGGRIRCSLTISEGLPKAAPCVVPIDVHVPGSSWHRILYRA